MAQDSPHRRNRSDSSSPASNPSALPQGPYSNPSTRRGSSGANRPLGAPPEPELSKLYAGIRYMEEAEEGTQKVRARAVHWYVALCKRLHRISPGLGAGGKFEPAEADAVAFLGWTREGTEEEFFSEITPPYVLRPDEFSAAYKMVFLLALAVSLLSAVAVLYTPLIEYVGAAAGGSTELALGFILLPLLALIGGATWFFKSFPVNEAALEKTRALTYVPEIVGYMIMSMKLVPNLEKAIEFAANHGRGKIADDFKKVIFDTNQGLYNSIPEGLDALAERWGNYSDELKYALRMIRASALENTESKRYQVLDRVMNTILDSIRNKMEDYARSLSQPTTTLFYLGVLLPLILIIVLPVGSAFSGSPLATLPVLVIIYNIALPVIIYVYASSVIRTRPPTYEPPKIPDNYFGIPPKGKMLIGKSMVSVLLVTFVVALLGVGFAWVMHTEGLPPKSLFAEGEQPFQIIAYDKTVEEVIARESSDWTTDRFEPNGQRYNELLANGVPESKANSTVALEKLQFFTRAENDVTPYALVFGLMITFSVCLAVYLHYRHAYKRAKQLEIIQLENEFKDSLYLLASRLGENKPLEDAIKRTQEEYMKNALISKTVFARTISNIELLGLPVRAAFFDPLYGSIRDLPSNIIRSSVQLMVDSVQLGVNVAARTLMSLSMQLRNSEKVTRMLSTLISDTTSMMKTMVVFIAPVVLGITTALQKIVMLTLANISTDDSLLAVQQSLQDQTLTSAFGGANISVPSLGSFEGQVFTSLVTPLEFLVIVCLYLIQLVAIMAFFTTKIEEDNDLMVRLNAAWMLPIAVIVFLVTVMVANLVVGGFFQGG